MKFNFSFTVSFLCCMIVASAQKSSYPANYKKIENIAFMTGGCLTAGCYTWANLILLHEGTLLEQTGAHYPAGAKSRFIDIGKWRMAYDTIYLDVSDTANHNSHLYNKYRMVTLYERLILIPVDTGDVSSLVEKQISDAFPSYYNDYFGFGLDEPGFKDQIGKQFENFVRTEYSFKYKLMVGELYREKGKI